MGSPIRKLRTLTTFAQVWSSGFARSVGLRPARDRMLRPRIRGDVPRHSPDEISTFIERTGGNPSVYRDQQGSTLVPHVFFATWGLPEFARALIESHLPLNFTRVVHASSSVRIHRLPTVDEPLRFMATVETVVRTGKRVRIEQQLTTMTVEAQPVANYTLAIVIPDPRSSGKSGRRPETVPSDVQELALWDLPRNEGWTYAKLSGDFNPIHWSKPFARLTGLRGPIVHGFNLMARASHLAVERLAGGDPNRLRALDVSFRRPLVLPSQAHVMIGARDRLRDDIEKVPLWVAPGPGEVANVVGYAEVQQ